MKEEQIRRAMDGDADAFLELMEQLSDRMYKIAWSILKQDQDAADAIQESILTCFEKISTLRSPGSFSTWVTRILINECYKILRREKPYVTASEELIRSIPAGEDGMEHLRFQELLALADTRDHLLLTLYYGQGYPIARIAELTGIKENTVKTRLARAREQIRRGLDEEDRVSCGN